MKTYKHLLQMLLLCVAVFVLMSATATATAAETKARNSLNANEKAAYDTLKTGFSKLMREGGSTVFTIDTSKMAEGKFSVPYDKLTKNDRTQAQKKIMKALNLSKVIIALESDCPYEMTWCVDHDLDNDYILWYYTTPQGASYSYIKRFQIRFHVLSEYQDNSKDYTVSKDAVKKFENAAKNAQEIVKKYTEKSDAEKLKAYFDEIRRLAKYDYEGTGQANRYSIVRVFDKDDKTNVVCEGFAKAFQYLCNLSQFKNSKVRTVFGSLDNGGHAWNIVTLGDKNYLVDVTNNIFMATATSGNITDGFTVKDMMYRYGHHNPRVPGVPKEEYEQINTRSLWNEKDLLITIKAAKS